MAKPPKPYRLVSKDTLIEIFNSGKWSTRLAGQSIERREIYNKPAPDGVGMIEGTRCIGYKYFENGILIAVVFYYHFPRGLSKPTPKLLMVDGEYIGC